MSKKVCVLGLGYIGLPTALLLAEAGHNVLGVDTNEFIVESLKNGKITINEPGLDILLQEAYDQEKLSIINDPSFSDIFIICVPTPMKNEFGRKEADLTYVYKAVENIIPFLKDNNILIIESTIPVGTMDKINDIIFSANIKNIKLAYCPERVLPGNIITELKSNNRIIGTVNQNHGNDIKKFMSSFVTGSVTITNFKTAEMSKLTENAYRDLNIAFANEISMICENQNIDVWELINLVNKHPRVNVLQPGCGVGGHCIAIDPWFLISQFEEKTPLIKQARVSNLKKTDWVLNQILYYINKFEDDKGKNPVVGILGLTYKPNVDDLRESPALEIARKIMSKSLVTLISDPFVKDVNNIKISSTTCTVDNSDIIVVLVAHDIYKSLKISKEKILLDFVNIIS